MKTKEEIKAEAEKRYPTDISLEGVGNSNRKQRKNQQIFIEGAEYAQTRWIPCSERLPDKGLYSVFCESDSGQISTCLWWNGKHWCFDYMISCGEPLYSSPFWIEVTHWQERPSKPLPDSPNIKK